MFEKEPRKLGRLHKVKTIKKPPFWIKNNQAKQNRNKKMIKTEICLMKFVFRVCLEKVWKKHMKKRRTVNRNKTNHEQFYSTWSERFWCQEIYWTQAVTNHTNSMFNLVSCIQVIWLCYEIIPFIVSSGNLSNSRKWLVTDSNDFCRLISHCFLVFRFMRIQHYFQTKFQSCHWSHRF